MSPFNAPDQPRSQNGQFASAQAKESAVSLVPARDPLMVPREDAEWVLEEFPDLEFDNRSGLDGDTMMLHEMGEPLSADGNCESVSDAVIELGAAELGAERLDKATILDPTGGFHCAVVAGKGDQEWVVDYTLRQFDDQADFPYVGTLDDWHAKIQSSTGLPWEWASNPSPDWNWESRFYDEFREAAENPTASSQAKYGALSCLNENARLEFLDHSPGAEDDETIELYRMKDADTARGNCWAASGEIIELGPEALSAEWVEELVMSGRGQHVAILAGYPEGPAVVDFTIRQFDASLPFPWTGTVDGWKATVEKATGTTWELNEDDMAA